MPCELSALQMLWWSTIAGGSRGLPRRSTPCYVGGAHLLASGLLLLGRRMTAE
jgi:hypothetical protein